jgi:transcriptional regulator with XRE-family HTH domain
MKIGKALRSARKEAGLTQEALAKKAKIDRTYVIFLEQDKQSPTLDTFARICRALGMTPTNLMSLIEKAQRKT